MKNKYLGQLLHSVIILLDALLQVSDIGDVRAFIEGMAKHVPNCKKSMLLVVDQEADQVVIHHGIGWPTEWSRVYLREELHHVDPVMKSLAGKMIVWSDLLAHPASPEENLFLMLSHRAGMTEGVSWSEIRGRYRITLDLSGAELERDELTASLLDSIMPRLADVVARLLSNRPQIERLSERDCRILQCMIDGKTDVETGDLIGLSERSVRDIIKKIRTMYAADTRCHLLKILFGLSFSTKLNSQN